MKNQEFRVIAAVETKTSFPSLYNQQKAVTIVPTLRSLWLASHNSSHKYSRRIRFSKIFFYSILIQVQGNKRTRIYLTGHGNETVKVYFLDPLFSRTRTCKWIQKVVLQKRSKMYYTVEMALDRGVTSLPWPQSCTELTRQRSLFVLFLILFYSKKKATTQRQQRINNIEKWAEKRGKVKVLASVH